MKHVELVNTNPVLVQIFLAYLRTLNIDEKRLRGRLFIHDEKNAEEYAKFWSNLTGIPLSQFGKIMIKKGSKFRRNKCRYGIFVVRYHDKEIFEKIEKDIEFTLDILDIKPFEIVKVVIGPTKEVASEQKALYKRLKFSNGL